MIAVIALRDVIHTPPEPVGALTVHDHERLLVIAPHPDDETLGAGGLIQRVLARHGTVQVVWVTAGDGNVGGVVLETGLRQPPAANFVAYGERRVSEARDALHKLGAAPDALRILGFPDGGLMPMLSRHWRRAEPARSATTGASDPPYAFAVDPDVAYAGTDLRDELARVFDEVRPTLIVLPDPLDVHPDHRATAVFTVLAIDEWVGGRWPNHAPPRVLSYLIHWPDWPPGWDAATPNPADAEGSLTLPPTLPPRPLEIPLLTLTPSEVAGKAGALVAHASQQRAMGSFLAAFVRRSEPFSELDLADIRSIALEYERGVEQHVKSPARLHAG